MLCTCNKNILVKLLKLVRLLKNLQKFFSNRAMAINNNNIIKMNKHWKYTLKWTAHQQPPTKKCIATYTKHTWTYTSFHTRARFYKRASSFFGRASLLFYRLNKKQTLFGIFRSSHRYILFLVEVLYYRGFTICWSTCVFRCEVAYCCFWKYTRLSSGRTHFYSFGNVHSLFFYKILFGIPSIVEQIYFLVDFFSNC